MKFTQYLVNRKYVYSLKDTHHLLIALSALANNKVKSYFLYVYTSMYFLVLDFTHWCNYCIYKDEKFSAHFDTKWKYKKSFWVNAELITNVSMHQWIFLYVHNYFLIYFSTKFLLLCRFLNLIWSPKKILLLR